jgi:hypothetical protein
MEKLTSTGETTTAMFTAARNLAMEGICKSKENAMKHFLNAVKLKFIAKLE